jgi:hypothetical protein
LALLANAFTPRAAAYIECSRAGGDCTQCLFDVLTFPGLALRWPPRGGDKGRGRVDARLRRLARGQQVREAPRSSQQRRQDNEALDDADRQAARAQRLSEAHAFRRAMQVDGTGWPRHGSGGPRYIRYSSYKPTFCRSRYEMVFLPRLLATCRCWRWKRMPCGGP